MFENLLSQLNNIPRKHTTYDVSNNRYINPSMLDEKLKNINMLEDNQLLEVLKVDYFTILQEIFEKQNTDYIKLFSNHRFLTIFTHAINFIMSRKGELNYLEKIYINKLIYDYMCKIEKDEVIKIAYISLAKIVNRSILPQIMALGIPEEMACTIAISRYASSKEPINIKRVNLTILSLPVDLMTVQVIVDLFGILFDKMGLLFETIMFDYNIDNGNTEEEGEIYSRISNALLHQLENMRLDHIRIVLKMYIDDYFMLHSNETPRFSLRSINSSDYPRINQVVDAMEYEGIYIP